MKLFYNGVIHTMDEAMPQVEAVLVNEAGRIHAIGTFEQLSKISAERVDLQGKTLLPGFNDAHIHVSWLGLQLTQWVDARNHVAPEDAGPRTVFPVTDVRSDVWRRRGQCGCRAGQLRPERRVHQRAAGKRHRRVRYRRATSIWR